MQITILVIIPICLAAFLIFVSKKYTLNIYIVASIVVICLGVVAWVLIDNLNWSSGLSGGGIRSWALPPVAVSISLVCALKSLNKYVVAGELFGSFVIANIWYV
jgi:hypothetical protein